MRSEEEQLQHRLDELAGRTARTGLRCWTGFLSPAEAEWAFASSRRLRVNVTFEGGYEDAERRIGVLEKVLLTLNERDQPLIPPEELRNALAARLGVGEQRVQLSVEDV